MLPFRNRVNNHKKNENIIYKVYCGQTCKECFKTIAGVIVI